jgi:predicted Zn-dependent protease
MDLVEKISWILLIVTLVSFGIHYAYAEDTMNTLGFEHRYNPVTCIMEPPPNIQDKFHDTMFAMTYESVRLWSTEMYDYTGGNWYIPMRYYEHEEHFDKTPDYFPECNIFIEYRQYNGSDGNPHKSKSALGYTSFDFSKSSHQYAYVMVFFEVTQENPKITLCIGCVDKPETEVTVNIEYIPILDEAINRIIMHEFGHALGIGHYIDDDTRLNNEDSLMYPTLDPFGTNTYTIEVLDKEVLIFLYHEDGFNGIWGTPQRTVLVNDLIQ